MRVDKRMRKRANRVEEAEVLTGVGCPSKMESTLRRVSRCSLERRPASHQAAYRMGQA